MEEDFYVLKFPHKLWRIVNECDTGAIQWGIYGKTILIDYNLFQAQYLECEVPKFKTRNMTSFVRQLNMYGFKKMQTQLKSDSSRCCNIHEFFHNFFRFGRNDLLDSVKRRPTPVKGSREVQNLVYHNNQTRLQMCRDAFAKALQRSKDRVQQDGRRLNHQASHEGDHDLQCNQFDFQVIPVENSLKDVSKNAPNSDITVEVSSKFQYLTDMNTEIEDYDNKSDEGNSVEENHPEDRVQEYLPPGDQFNIQSFNETCNPVEKNFYFGDYQTPEPYTPKSHQVHVKKAFDGVNYVIDLMVGCPDGTANMEQVVTKILEAELYNECSGDEIHLPVSDRSTYPNESSNDDQYQIGQDQAGLTDPNDAYYDVIANSYLGI